MDEDDPNADEVRPVRVIQDGLRFRRRLRIGDTAFAELTSPTLLKTVLETGSIAAKGAGIAQSGVVASTFFAPSGLMASLGLATAATPVGWVVAAGLLTGAGYLSLKRRWWSAGDENIDRIPKCIHTPIDLLGAGLFDMMGTLALRVARADGHVDTKERTFIAKHFVAEWGYDPSYVEAMLPQLEVQDGDSRLWVLAKALAEFQASNPDCNAAAMQAEFLDFLRELIRADGRVTAGEERALRTIELALAAEHAYFSREAGRQLRSLASGVGGALGGAMSGIAAGAAAVAGYVRGDASGDGG